AERAQPLFGGRRDAARGDPLDVRPLALLALVALVPALLRAAAVEEAHRQPSSSRSRAIRARSLWRACSLRSRLSASIHASRSSGSDLITMPRTSLERDVRSDPSSRSRSY